MSISSISGGSASAPPAGNSGAIRALEGQAKKIEQELKSAKDDCGLSANAKTAKLTQLQAALQLVEAQIQELRSSQQQPAAKPVDDPEKKIRARAARTPDTGQIVDVQA
jgi:hypothetical protein